LCLKEKIRKKQNRRLLSVVRIQERKGRGFKKERAGSPEQRDPFCSGSTFVPWGTVFFWFLDDLQPFRASLFIHSCWKFSNTSYQF